MNGASTVRPGQVFEGRYEITNLLGTGGFGQVWRALQRSTGQPVAIKVMRHDGGPPEERAVVRFRREMQLCAALRHPNIVRLVDTGRTADGVLFTVFEYVPGQTLAEVLHLEGALAPAEARRAMMQVLDALGAAHAMGVIHRDLKPQNIMLTRTGARRNALVLDFGIGTLVGEASLIDVEHVTSSHEVLGTPAYASPEQLRGESLTPASDLYSWGLVFVECLTGQRVMRARRFHELVYLQTGPEPVRLPRWLEQHELGAVLRAALEKDVDLRARGVAHLLHALEACDLDDLRSRAEPSRSPGVEVTPRMRQGADREGLVLMEAVPVTASRASLLAFETYDPLASAPARGTFTSATPFVGRQEELGLLTDRWRRAAGGTGQALLLLGEPGIGKTRLVRQLGEAVQAAGHTWVGLSCRRAPGAGSPLAELSRHLLGAPAAREAEELLGVLHGLASDRPLVLCAEDLHLADEAVLELLGDLIRDLGEASILLVATAWPEFASPWAAGALMPVALGGLEPAQAAALALAVAGDLVLDDEVLADLVRRADGVPSFVEALVAMLRARGAADALTFRRLIADEVPVEVRASVAARLGGLGPARHVARAAALLGREFDRERLRVASDERAEDVERLLQILVNADLITRRRRGRVVEWEFRHPLVRDAIHDEVLPSERRVIATRLAARGL